MTPVFSSNADLYSYLARLRQSLADRGAIDLAKTVDRALRFASGMSAEFLGESRIALRMVSEAKNNALNQSEREVLSQAISGSAPPSTNGDVQLSEKPFSEKSPVQRQRPLAGASTPKCCTPGAPAVHPLADGCRFASAYPSDL